MTAPAAELTALSISVFDSEHDAQVKHRAVTLDEVFARMTDFRAAATQAPVAPCWSTAMNTTTARPAVPWRSSRSIGLVYDIDSGVTPTELQDMLGNLRYCLATTFSSTQEHWKQRLAIGLHSPIPDWSLRRHLGSRAGCAGATATPTKLAKDCSRIYFNAAHPIGYAVQPGPRRRICCTGIAGAPDHHGRTRAAAREQRPAGRPSAATTLPHAGAVDEADPRARARHAASCRRATARSSRGSSETESGRGCRRHPQRVNDPWLEDRRQDRREHRRERSPTPTRPQPERTTSTTGGQGRSVEGRDYEDRQREGRGSHVGVGQALPAGQVRPDAR